MTSQPTDEIEPVAVDFSRFLKLSGYSRQTGYKLLKSGEIRSYLEGRRRMVEYASIKEYVQRKLEASQHFEHARHPERKRVA